MSETTACFRAWRFDRTRGGIEGLHPLDDENLPYEHCRLVSDEQGRLIRLEEYKPGSPLPAVKLLGYESPEAERILEALDYNPDGTLRLIHRYVYDETGRMVDRIELDGEEGPRGHVTSTWDEQGNEVEECAYRPDGRVHARHAYGHDEQGRLTLERIYDGDGQLQGTRELDYDDRDNVTEKRWHGPDGALQTRFVHVYDDASRIVRSELYGADGALRGSQAFAYDACGNPVTSGSG